MKLSFYGADRDVTGSCHLLEAQGKRILIGGAERIKLFGDTIQVRVPLHAINGFSAHADRDEWLTWHSARHPARTILVHGEEKALRSFAEHLHGTSVDMPRKGDEIVL
ncbi:MBL fold metallo-hydrolase RNA specificity domain-containing protein [Acidihalobacter ferrooxydans]|uniref:Zn-dependent metallo-hydrolase RNA specificity domain-containing protein n=1 Tax=Acidihalobacter ferrooxydans TaxID=1765967 RepID=A0A1P8UIM3_9GAMM|nr:MBL fold metallo-hydrolase RNA specificity domain-containing protein [Acidihalobacter ferrooxydans]APZ43680.1 hypothetical protein BW247_11755 [Acidihalobacter ferrooxydans]